MENRRSFLQKSCMLGLCLCGFQSVLPAVADTDATPSKAGMWQNWIARLLQNMHDKLTDEQCRELMYTCAVAHYEQLQMDKLLAPFVGNTEAFCHFLEKEWGWKLDYRKSEQLIVANENKTQCVCPLVDTLKGGVAASLCYCSEGFAARMFAEVTRCEVQARVLSSIHRGDPHCIYQIKIVSQI